MVIQGTHRLGHEIVGRRAIRRSGSIVASVLLLGAAITALTAEAPAHAASDDEFLVVDCLLPGRVRRLGRNVTYLTARKAVKTSATDCEIRGGEYVSQDRSSYATALKIWLPLAEEGDIEAQYYVGEIFEKGLGLQPDYLAAAQWYMKAADAGSSRAAVQLGSLYEQGLGVPKNPAEAVKWYRRAAGISTLDFDVAPPTSPTPGESAEVAQLREEVERLRGELNRKQQELDRTQSELNVLREQFRQRQGEAAAERDQLAGLRRQLDQARQQQADAAEVEALETQIQDREARLQVRDQEIAQLKAQLTNLEGERQGYRAEIARLKGVNAAEPPEIEIVEPQLVATRGTHAVTLRSPQDQLLVIGRIRAPQDLLSLTVNGQEVGLETADLFRTHIALTGQDDQVTVVAVDRNGKRSSLEFAVLGTRSNRQAVVTATKDEVGLPIDAGMAIEFGRYHALVIGNNDYKLLPPLRTAVTDATELAKLLERDYGFNVTLLLNATRYDILSGLNRLREQLTDDDNLLIYYAGHGELDRVNQRGNWLPIDAEPTSTANWISNIAITDILNAMSVRQLLVVADSCYSGALTRNAIGILDPGQSQQARLKLVKEMVRQRSRMVLTSGGVEPVLDSVGGKHSVFSQAFLGALEKNVGLVAGQELFQLVLPKVADAAGEADFRQIPEYAPIKFAGHESGDFFFVRR